MPRFSIPSRFNARTSGNRTSPFRFLGWLPLLAMLHLATETSGQERLPAWTSKEGKTIQAEFIGLESGVLKIRKDGKLFEVPLSRLAPASRFQAKQRSMVQAIERENADVKSPVSRSAESLSDLWDRMHRRPQDPYIVLALATHSPDITQFFYEELAPIQLTEDVLKELLTDLCSDDTDTWRDAYEQLSSLNPQLALTVEELLALESFKEFPYRNRLVDVIVGEEIDSPYSASGLEFKKIELRKAKDGTVNFLASEPAVPGYANYSYSVMKVGEEFKTTYNAITHALALLEYMNTPQAMRLIERMALGDPRVSVTRIASDILARRASPESDDAQPLEDQWNNLDFEGRFYSGHAVYTSTIQNDRRLLALLADPTATTNFLAQKLKPQSISRDELERFLEDFCSDEDSRWKNAYERLQTFSPLLEFSVSDLLEHTSFQEYPARHRLVDLLTGTQIDSPDSATNAKFEVVTLKEQPVYGEPAICMNYENPDPESKGGFGVSGVKCFPLFLAGDSDNLRALPLLARFNTPEANELIKSLATGHPKLASTRQAQELLKVRSTQ